MGVVGFIFTYVTPYVAVAVFFGGIAYRLFRWSRKEPVGAHLSLFPRPEGRVGRVADALADTFSLKGLLRVNRLLWLGSFVMHVGLLLILVGHVRAFTEFTFLWNLLDWGPERQDAFSATAGTIAGTLFTVPLFYLLARRWSGAVKWLSTPEDFLILYLLIGIGLTGFHMRLLRHVQVEELHRFFRGLATFDWQPSPVSTGSSFLYHFAFVQLLMIYFPFGKLTHTIGSVRSKMVARS